MATTSIDKTYRTATHRRATAMATEPAFAALGAAKDDIEVDP